MNSKSILRHTLFFLLSKLLHNHGSYILNSELKSAALHVTVTSLTLRFMIFEKIIIILIPFDIIHEIKAVITFVSDNGNDSLELIPLEMGSVRSYSGKTKLNSQF